MKGPTTNLVSDINEHKKAVTYFALFEQGNILLSGSADKKIRVITFINLFDVCVLF